MKRRVISFIFVLMLCIGFGQITYGAGQSDSREYGPGTFTATLTETYNQEMGLYEQQFPGGRRFVTNIPNGGQMYDAAFLFLGGGIKGRLERDGAGVNIPSDGYLYEPGFYILTAEAQPIGKTAVETAVFSFRLLGQPRGAVDTGEYSHPKIVCGTEVQDVKGKDGWHRFVLPNYKSVFSSLSKNNSTVSSASFYIPGNVNASLTRDGEAAPLINQVDITAPGQYQLKVWAESYGPANGCPVWYETTISFTIPLPESEAAQAFSGIFGSGGSQSAENKNSEKAETLNEIYHENAVLYEEAFSNGTVFYSNIANGSISGGNVYLDIPANISVSMMRDGRPAAFESKAPINEEGTYLLNLSTSYKEGGGVHTLTSTFRFRIQKSFGNEIPGDEALSEQLEGEDLPPVESDIDLPAETEGTPSSGAEYVGGVDYDADLQMFRHPFMDGSSFYISVPQNGVVNDSVYAEVPESATAVLSVDDGEPRDYESGTVIGDHGSYALKVRMGTGETVTWRFRIVLHAVNDLTEFTAPDGYLIESVNCSGESGESSETIDASSYNLSEDGTYSFIMKGEDAGLPELFSVVILDTKVPVITLEGVDEKGKAKKGSFFYFCDEENATVTIKKGNKTINPFGNRIEGSGSYTITAVDAAGNVGVYHVKAGVHLNMFSYVLLAMLAVLVGGLVIFYSVNRKQMKVR